ncbi:MAG: hypothetical protein A2Y60_01695 [Chloroflexi bacterium RBG_13_54_9]|nr:MAG: hypothetical protein A2Y60_01695 [Chloroflexi bacterium RBG_13_54_9]
MNSRRNGDETLSRLERAGYGFLRSSPEEETGWEIVRIETIGTDQIRYGFRAPYNDLIVSGLASLQEAKDIAECRMITSYVEMELQRQTY